MVVQVQLHRFLACGIYIYVVTLRINLAAARHNIRRIKELVTAPIYAVVKADAYGHGAEFCRHIESEVFGFAVSCASEAEELRRLKIKKPILILCPIDRAIDFDDIIYTVCGKSDLDILPKKRGIKVAIKINTGMNRLGATVGNSRDYSAAIGHKNLGKRSEFSCSKGNNSDKTADLFLKKRAENSDKSPNKFSSINEENLRNSNALSGFDGLGGLEELEELVAAAREKGFEVSEIFTHFSAVKHAENQFLLFSSCVERLGIQGHCCASNCLDLPPKMHGYAVRCGLALYGYGHSGLLPILSAYTLVGQINSVKKGMRIGYGDTVAERDMRVAVLKGGYADGIRRAEGRRVRINGYTCPIVGKICMDMCMADITEAYVEQGDRAYFLDSILNAEVLSSELGTIPYEILTMFSAKRIQRIYD